MLRRQLPPQQGMAYRWLHSGEHLCRPEDTADFFHRHDGIRAGRSRHLASLTSIAPARPLHSPR